VEEFQVFIWFNRASLLYIILQLIIISLFKEDRKLVNWNTIVNGLNKAIVLDDIRTDVVSPVVVGGVLHIIWQNVFNPFLIYLIIIKYLNHNYKSLWYLMRVETDFENLCIFHICIHFTNTDLIVKDIIKDALQKSKTGFKDNIWKLFTSKYSLLHFF